MPDQRRGTHTHMKTCPDCNGDGVIEKGADDEQQCPTCGGSGFVPDDSDDQEEVIRTRQSIELARRGERSWIGGLYFFCSAFRSRWSSSRFSFGDMYFKSSSLRQLTYYFLRQFSRIALTGFCKLNDAGGDQLSAGLRLGFAYKLKRAAHCFCCSWVEYTAPDEITDRQICTFWFCRRECNSSLSHRRL